MINQESQLKLQAFLDGELSAREASQVTEWLTNDEAAQALLNELENTCGALAGFEVGVKLPESREFFWSKIEREIGRQAKAEPATQGQPFFAWLQRHILSMSSAAVAVCLLGLLTLNSGKAPKQFGEMELANDDMGAYTFRDHQAQLTMVWLYNHDDSQLSDAGSVAKLDTE